MLGYKCIIFDLDGTIYFGNNLADKANEVIKKSRSISDYIFFVTNNSAKTRQEIYERLVEMGIDVELNEVITSSYAIGKYLKDNNIKSVYCIGTESLANEIKNNGIDINNDFVETVVVGYNKDFKLDDLTELLNSNISTKVSLIVANKERAYPTKNKMILGAAGPIVSAVECVLNKQTDKIIGKPNKIMLDIVLKDLGLDPKEVCVIGDSLESDVKMAQNYGADYIWITDSQTKEHRTIKKLEELLEIL